MNCKRQILQGLCVVAVLWLAPVNRCGADITLDFEGLQNFEPILNYYNGGYGGGDSFVYYAYTGDSSFYEALTNPADPAHPGPDMFYSASGLGPSYGISFSPNALALVTGPGGGAYDAASGNSIAFLIYNDPNGLYNNSVTMNINGHYVNGVWQDNVTAPLGWSGQIGLFYAAGPDADARIRVYSGPDGTGTLIGDTQTLAPTYDYDQTGGDIWGTLLLQIPQGLTARSIIFSSTENVGVDDIAFFLPLNSSTLPPVSEPTSFAAWSVLVLGLIGLIARRSRVMPEPAKALAR